jgi:protein-disulfide isomerase
MRVLLALLSVVLLTGAAPRRDWNAVATKTPAGAYVIGNPAARVKLVEYASYTCSHCAAFSGASEAVLRKQMIASGSTSLELRHFIRDKLDLAAAILARCTGPRGFAATSAAIFAAQPQWLQRGIEYQQANGARIGLYPTQAQLRANADGSGLTALVKTRGLSEPAIAACFADQAEIDRIVALTSNAPSEIDSTPTFYVNGKRVPHAAWAQLEPALRAAGAK